MTGKTIEQIKLGDTAYFSKTVSESDVYLYAGITGDLNPPISMKPTPKIPSSKPGLPTAC